MKPLFSSVFTLPSTTRAELISKDVKTTSTFDHSQNEHKNFSAAELWNIQRQRKSRIQRRYM